MREAETKRLLLVTGKGGVGKSTCALAVAVTAARKGREVLLCEVSNRCASSDFMGVRQASHVPTRPLPVEHPRLWTAALDPARSLQEYFTEQLGIPRLAKLATQNRALGRLWNAAPSVHEMALLNTIARYHSHEAPHSGVPKFDLIVVDLPATGHALTLLGVPRGFLGMVKVGSLAKRARAIDAMLHDTEGTGVVVVTIPEELPINETAELVQRLERDLAMDASQVVVNDVHFEMFGGVEHRRIFDRIMQEVDSEEALRAVSVARVANQRWIRQMDQIDILRDRVRMNFIQVAHSALTGFARIEFVANALSAPAKVPA